MPVKKVSKKELEMQVEEFLKESNAIEGVTDEVSLKQAKYAWEFLMKQKKLDRGVILKTHKILMLKDNNLLPNEKGYFRTCNVRVGEYVAPGWETLSLSVESWLDNMNNSIKQFFTNPKERFKRDHITFEKIHPFIDGNGRTGLMFMNWARLKAGFPLLIIHTGKEQATYYKWFK